MTVLDALKRNQRKRMIRQWMRELPAFIEAIVCMSLFVLIGILLAYRG